ncbi:MAG: hypothetical protein ACYCW6_29140, partial [Candidatus Xenobia bacterium]
MASALETAQAELARGNDGGFVQACLEAYDENPEAPESLRMLADWLRTRGRHDACCAVCEMAPQDPILRFEAALAANGSKIMERREQGRLLCRTLMLDPLAAPLYRGLLREAWNRYAVGLRDLIGAASVPDCAPTMPGL